MRHRILAMAFICILASQGGAASFKKYAGEFLYTGVGGRALGLAGAYTAVANDVNAGYWNPAGLTAAEGFQVQFMHSKQFISSIQNNYLAVSHPMQNGSFLAVSMLYLTVSDIKDSRAAYNEILQRIDPSRVKLFNTGDYTFLLSYARQYSDALSWGINVKTIYRDYEVESALGFGFDFGLRYTAFHGLQIGLMAHDVTTTMLSWSTGEKEFIAPSLRTGLAYTWNLSALNLRVMPAMDFNILFEGREYASQIDLGPVSLDTIWGLEIAYGQAIGLRIGFDDLNRFSTGVGIQIPRIAFDYSFTEYESELGNIHRISLHLMLEKIF